jgi:hypothetical protein
MEVSIQERPAPPKVQFDPARPDVLNGIEWKVADTQSTAIMKPEEQSSVSTEASSAGSIAEARSLFGLTGAETYDEAIAKVRELQKSVYDPQGVATDPDKAAKIEEALKLIRKDYGQFQDKEAVPTEQAQLAPGENAQTESLLDLDQPKDESTLEVIDWESLSEVQRLEESIEQLRQLQYPESELQSLRDALAEAQAFLKKKSEESPAEVATNTTPEPSPDALQAKEKGSFSMRQVAGIGMLILIDSAFNHGYGTSQLIEMVMREQVMPGFMGKLGFDKEMIDTLFPRRMELSRAVFQLDHASLVHFLSNMSKTEAYHLLDTLSDTERTELVEHGNFEHRSNVLSQDEIKRFILNKLSDTDKQRLKITPQA